MKTHSVEQHVTATKVQGHTTISARKYVLLAIAILALAATSAFAGTQSLDLYNTGQDNGHGVLSPGTIDPHYILLTNPYDGSPDAFAVNTHSSWILPSAASTSWISPCQVSGDVCQNDHDTVHTGHYIYQMTFDLGAGFSSATLSGEWAADNNATMYINGHAVSNGGTTPTVGFDALTNFSIVGDAGIFNFGGSNTLTFDVFQAPSSFNGADPTGLLVQVTGTESTPEPSSLLLMGSGLFGLGGFLRRRLLS